MDTTLNNSQDEHPFPVIVIGAGLAGLVAAAHLASRGIQPLILEADSIWPGGRLSGGDPDTFTHNGHAWSFNPDHGVHAVWGGYENLRATLERFTQTQLIDSAGEEWINRWEREVRAVEAGSAVRGGVIPAPFHYLQLLFRPRFWTTITPLDFLSLPGYLFSTLWAVSFDPIREKKALDGLMMRDFFLGWTPNLRATFTGVGANMLAAPPEQTSLTAFIAALRFYTILRRDAWQMQYFPANSHDSLIQPLVDYIESCGGQFIHGATATQLHHTDDHWRVVFEDSGRAGLRSAHAHDVILAINAPGAERLLKNSPSTQERANQMTFPGAARNVVIRLWFDAQPRAGTDGGMFTGDFLPDNFFWLHRLYEEFAEWRDVGSSAIELHFYGNDSLLDLPERNLIIQAVDEVQRAFPALRGHFVHAAVRRNSKVHTLFRVPTADSLHVTTPWPNLHAAGDWVGYDTPSLWMERATTTGIAAANAALEKHRIEPYPVLQPRSPGMMIHILALLIRGLRVLFRPLVWVGRRLRGYRG